MIRQPISTDRAPAAFGAYSQAIVAGGFVFCSGTAGIDPATGTIPPGIEAQTEQALLNLSAVVYRGRRESGRPGEDDNLLRRRRGLRKTRHRLCPPHAGSAPGPLRPRERPAAARPARLDRGDRDPVGS